MQDNTAAVDRTTQLADELRSLATAIEQRPADNPYSLLKDEMRSSDRLLWEAYRRGWFGADDVADWAARTAQAEDDAGDDEPGGFTANLLSRWAMIRLPGFSVGGCAVDLTRRTLPALLRAVASKATAASTTGPGELTQTHQVIVNEIRGLGAVSCNDRVTKRQIATRTGHQESSLNDPLAELVRMNVLGSKKGRGGGYWVKIS